MTHRVVPAGGAEDVEEAEEDGVEDPWIEEASDEVEEPATKVDDELADEEPISELALDIEEDPGEPLVHPL